MRLINLIILFTLAGIVAKAQTEGELLEKAYKKKSLPVLKDFFETWHNDIKPIADEELGTQNDTIVHAYRAFSAFYNPLDLERAGGSEWGDDIYNNVTYLIVQDRLWIYLKDKIFYTDEERDKYAVEEINRTIKSDITKQRLLKRENGKLANNVLTTFAPDNHFSTRNEKRIPVDSILNFRPQITCNKTPLYLTKKYDEILNAFLGNSHYKLGTGGIMNPARSNGESEKRKVFLENYIKIWHGHWGGYWQLNSYPTCSSITFDKNFEYAKIEFVMVYEGGEAIMKNENGVWRLISSKRTWIE